MAHDLPLRPAAIALAVAILCGWTVFTYAIRLHTGTLRDHLAARRAWAAHLAMQAAEVDALEAEAAVARAHLAHARQLVQGRLTWAERLTAIERLCAAEEDLWPQRLAAGTQHGERGLFLQVKILEPDDAALSFQLIQDLLARFYGDEDLMHGLAPGPSYPAETIVKGMGPRVLSTTFGFVVAPPPD